MAENYSFKDYINIRFKKRLQWYDKKAVMYKKLTYLFQVPIIIFASITPIIAALQYNVLTIIFSTSVAAGIGILRFGNFESYWRTYRNTCENLQRELIHFKSRTGVYKNKKKCDDLFIERSEEILSREHIRWKLTADKDYSEYVT